MKTKKLFLNIATASFVMTLIATIMLWVTRDVDLASQSEYWNQSNRIWYELLHFGMILGFFIVGAVLGMKYWLYGLVAFASGFTLMFDATGYRLPHNVSTALIFVLASLAIIIYEKKYKPFYLVLCIILGLIFLSSFIRKSGAGVYLIESIIEWVFGLIMILRIRNIRL